MQNTSFAVMAQRREARNSLDDFPTPPWATRALLEQLAATGERLADQTVWEPACNRGYMARVLHERFRKVYATDVHSYADRAQDEDFWRPGQMAVCDFLVPWACPQSLRTYWPDWIITNPPFRQAQQFALRGFEAATRGVALLVRTAFLEGCGRHADLFEPYPPALVLQFAERVPMLRGRLDPRGSTATAYCWVVWLAPFGVGLKASWPHFRWIPPCRARLEQPHDYGGAS